MVITKMSKPKQLIEDIIKDINLSKEKYKNNIVNVKLLKSMENGIKFYPDIASSEIKFLLLAFKEDYDNMSDEQKVIHRLDKDNISINNIMSYLNLCVNEPILIEEDKDIKFNSMCIMTGDNLIFFTDFNGNFKGITIS